MRHISKDIFLNAVACPTWGWLLRSGQGEELLPPETLGDRFRREQGIEIGQRARELYPGGALVRHGDMV